MAEQVVLVTGTGGGIGAACARDLLQDGNKVTALDVKPVHETVLKAAPEDNYIALNVDVSSLDACRDAVKQTIDKFGRLDAVCHFAAIHSTLNWEDVSSEEFNRVLEVNVVGSFHIAKSAGEWMKENGGGAIVLTSSGSVQASGVGGGSGRGGPAYVTSKAAIYGLNRSLARSLGPYGIRVNTVSPGATETPMIAEYTNASRDNAANRSMLGRIGEPEDVADVARFLISDKARYVTGEVISCSGGGSV
ncbi:MAG: SDR family NAD(P)-dependent oxidoreductase [Alphaproteobacteria bacterium]|jgi:3-oxoacyl-[acyl-carrier protein] reductase